MNLTNINDIKELLGRHGFRFSKSMGQNFLTASWVPEDIAETVLYVANLPQRAIITTRIKISAERPRTAIVRPLPDGVNFWFALAIDKLLLIRQTGKENYTSLPFVQIYSVIEI